MAVVIDADGFGIWAAMQCDHEGCDAHVTARPQVTDWSPDELVETVVGWAVQEGWTLLGVTFCPDHPPRARRRWPETIATAWPWARVVKGAR